MMFEFGDAAWAAGSDGIFIPVSDLPGCLAEELADDVSEEAKIGQTIHSMMKKVVGQLTGTSFLGTPTDPNKLGISYTLTENIPSTGLKNKTYTFTVTKLINLVAKSLLVIPVASVGTNSGKGDFSLTDIFPNCAKVAASANTSGAGVLIKSSILNAYGAATHAAIDLAADARQWLEAFLLAQFDPSDGLTVRATGVVSAFPSAPTRGQSQSVTLPAAASQATNPTTGINSSDLIKLSAISYTVGLTVQLIENSDDTVSVNVV